MKNTNGFKEARDRGGAYLLPQQVALRWCVSSVWTEYRRHCKTVTAFQACHWGGVGQTTVTNNFTAERVA